MWKVVVIDDSPDDRAEVRRLLLTGSDRRYLFIEAETGTAGVRATLDTAPDLVVLDYNLPDMDATKVLAELTGPNGATVCPIVVLTGSDRSDLGRAALRAGAQDFLGKSWMVAESLVRAVENASERWAIDRERRQREHFVERTTNVAPGVTYVFDLERQCNVFISRTVASVIGYSVEDIAAMGDNLVPTLMHPDDWAGHSVHLERVRALRDHETADFEHRMRDRVGEWRWFYSRDAVFSRTDTGAARELVGTAIEITARKQAEQTVVLQMRELDALYATTPTGLFQFDADLRFVRVNAWTATITGRSIEAHIGRTVGEVFNPDLAGLVERLLRQILQTGEPVLDLEVRGTTAAHVEERDWLASYYPVRSTNGEIIGVHGVVTDITARKQAEAALQASERFSRQLAVDLSESDRRKDEFLATLAHELRNPLAPIRTGLDVMRLSPSGTPAVERARTMMERHVGHMVRLMDDLMDVSRISRGRVELKIARVQARAILDDAVEASRSFMEADGHALVVNAVSESAWVDGDLTRLAQVVGNLLNNAAKYTPKGGRIELAARVEAGEVVITVTDNGAGIAADMLPNVFDLFAQVDRTLDRAKGGLGIGLSVVRKLVELHGGTVTAASPGAGLGSTFTVRLPLAATPPATQSAAANKPSTPRLTDSLCVLVVDDNLDAAELLSAVLELAGHDARAVHDGPAALAAARDVRPDVVFLDIGLPGMSGHAVARRFRAEAAFAGIVLVALTGWGSADDKRKSREAGFDHHLTKPVDLARVHELLAGIQRQGGDGSRSNHAIDKLSLT